ncbi:MAG: GNAT family N-acetyltransferase [Candidatus Hydrogenedentes bacterium]|nr:GNAT family N-acetyltransferase [Candidatus Hydrogenedentota bacterium]
MSGLRVRHATRDDLELLWRWANEPGTRAASFSSDPIPWDTHVAWFERKMADAACRLYIVTLASGEPAAQVRFDLRGPVADVSISVAAEHRGRGYAVTALELATAAFLAEVPAGRIHAYIKPDNLASLRTFAKAGYANEEACTVKGQRAVRLERSRLDG